MLGWGSKRPEVCNCEVKKKFGTLFRYKGLDDRNKKTRSLQGDQPRQGGAAKFTQGEQSQTGTRLTPEENGGDLEEPQLL